MKIILGLGLLVSLNPTRIKSSLCSYAANALAVPLSYVNLFKKEDKDMELLNTKQAFRLADLVDYQEGSVVSKTIVEKKTGTVTLFAFDEKQGLSEHTAPFDALVYLLDGEAEVVISGKAIKLKDGEMVIMPANEPHALKAVQRFKMILTMIRS
jgi:quercetin dioxygenase-like cupin family protein